MNAWSTSLVVKSSRIGKYFKDAKSITCTSIPISSRREANISYGNLILLFSSFFFYKKEHQSFNDRNEMYSFRKRR